MREARLELSLNFSERDAACEAEADDCEIQPTNVSIPQHVICEMLCLANTFKQFAKYVL